MSKWRSSGLSIALSPETMEDTLRRELSAFSDNSVVDLRLSGSVTMDEYDTRHNLLEDLLGRFIEGTYSDAELSRLISEEIIDAEFAETSFAAGFLKDLLDEPKEAQLAYELLTYNRFNAFAGAIAARRDRAKIIKRLEDDVGKYAVILAEWPNSAETLVTSLDFALEPKLLPG